MIEKLHDDLSNKTKQITSLHLLFIFIILTVDFYSMYDFGIEFKSFKYLINYKEFSIINITIITLAGLLALISRKNPLIFCLVLFFILIGVFFPQFANLEIKDVLAETIKNAGAFTLLTFLILYNSEKVSNFIDNFVLDFNKWILSAGLFFLSISLTICIFNHYNNLNYNWNRIIKDYDNTYYFEKNNTFNLSFLLNQKIFNTNRLETLQDDIIFYNSKFYLEQLKDKYILESNKLQYNEKLYVTYIKNNQYKTFFIVSQSDSNKTRLIILFTQENENINSYQILDIMEKEISIIAL